MKRQYEGAIKSLNRDNRQLKKKYRILASSVSYTAKLQIDHTTTKISVCKICLKSFTVYFYFNISVFFCRLHQESNANSFQMIQKLEKL